MTEVEPAAANSDLLKEKVGITESSNGLGDGGSDQPEKVPAEDGIETAKAVIAAPSDVIKGSATDNAEAPTSSDGTAKSQNNAGAEQSAETTPEAEASAVAPDAPPTTQPSKELEETPAGDAPPEPAAGDTTDAGQVPASSAEDKSAASAEVDTASAPDAEAPAAEAPAADAPAAEPSAVAEPASAETPSAETPVAEPAGAEPAATSTAIPVEAVAEVTTKPEAAAEEQQQAGNGPTPSAADTASAEANGGAASPKEAAAVTPVGTVQELSRRLSSASLQAGQTPPATTPNRSSSSSIDRQQQAPAAAVPFTAGSGARPAKSPSGSRSTEASPASAHDTKNTINVALLLKQGGFKMQPLKDFVQYAELQRLRLEDGIDATRKEDYLSDTDFKDVFGMDRDAFKKQPAWRQAQAKKKANLF
ncbi:hypothetical protein Agub_g5067 [Astrephomene gubernaculifera]|uniref:HP domain-containing protein n=1 Tax=Astrephomene gubernaculifera TaxID=47775 RepID=A0AAD3DMM8_9CHLO|nr:hypothetical protein Agub_g5067 [Astrephomene gubernaculifera]